MGKLWRGRIMNEEIFEVILFLFLCILGIVFTICESKGILGDSVIRTSLYFSTLINWKVITVLAMLAGIYVLWKYIGVFVVLFEVFYLVCILLIRKYYRRKS